MSLHDPITTKGSGAVVLIRFYVGLIFASEGVLKFLRPDQLGPGRFEKVGIPLPTFFAYLDGAFEIGCGVMILAGVLTRLAVVPMIVDMVGALLTTKLPLLWSDASLYPKEGGLWDLLHESRVEMAMLCGSVFLFIVGAGAYSLDERTSRATALAAVS